MPAHARTVVQSALVAVRSQDQSSWGLLLPDWHRLQELPCCCSRQVEGYRVDHRPLWTGHEVDMTAGSFEAVRGW